MLHAVALFSFLYTLSRAEPLFANSTSPTTTAGPTTTSCPYPVNPYAGSLGDGRSNNCFRSGNPQMNYSRENYYATLTTDLSMASSCSGLFESSLSEFKATGLVTTVTNTFWRGEENPEPYSTETKFRYQDLFSWKPRVGSGCCMTCHMQGRSVDVHFWPTSAPTPAVTELVNEVGFTYTWPSIYVVFHELYATDDYGDLGERITSKTMAFEPTELRTATMWSSPGPRMNPIFPTFANTWKEATWGDESDCTLHSKSFLQGTDGLTYSAFKDAPMSCQTHFMHCGLMMYTITWNPCKPSLSVPSQIYTLHPDWATCVDGITGFDDPPYTLKPGNGLFPVSVVTEAPAPPHPPPSSVSTTAEYTAEPANTPTPATVTPTVPQVPKASTTNRIQDPPVEGSPPQNSPSIPNPPSQETDTRIPSGGSPTIVDPPEPQQPPPSGTASRNHGPNLPQQSRPTPVVTAGQTILPGAAPVTISGTVYSLQRSGGALVIDGITSSLSPRPSPYVIGGLTITPGAAPVTISNTAYSLDPSGTALVVDGTTSLLSPPATPLVISGQTLLPGSVLVIYSTTYSLAPSGTALVVNGVTQDIPTAGLSTYIIGSKTLVAGAPGITVSGTVVSLMGGGQTIVVGGSTVPVNDILGSQTTADGGIGDAVLSLGGFRVPTSAGYTPDSSPTVVPDGDVFLEEEQVSAAPFGKRITWFVFAVILWAMLL